MSLLLQILQACGDLLIDIWRGLVFGIGGEIGRFILAVGRGLPGAAIALAIAIAAFGLWRLGRERQGRVSHWPWTIATAAALFAAFAAGSIAQRVAAGALAGFVALHAVGVGFAPDRFRQVRIGYYFLAPTLGLLALCLYVPMGGIFYISLFDYELGGSQIFAGLQNYANLGLDPIFWQSLLHLVLYTLVHAALLLSIPLAVAKLIFDLRTEAARYWFRAMFLMPIVVPGIVIYLIWGYMYSEAGIIPMVGTLLGFGSAAEGLLSHPSTALAAVIFVGFPFVSGIYVLVFYAGLDAIEPSVREAARIDGASGWQCFLRVELPLLVGQFRLLTTLALIGGIQAFENVMVMTQGGPGWMTMLPGLYMYRSAMVFNQFGYASALGVILFILALGATLGVDRVFRQRDGLPTT